MILLPDLLFLKYCKKTHLLFQKVNYVILSEPVGINLQFNIFNIREVKLKCHLIEFLYFNTRACPIDSLFNMFAEH